MYAVTYEICHFAHIITSTVFTWLNAAATISLVPKINAATI